VFRVDDRKRILIRSILQPSSRKVDSQSSASPAKKSEAGLDKNVGEI
jgi:hypothetical protein